VSVELTGANQFFDPTPGTRKTIAPVGTPQKKPFINFLSFNDMNITKV